MGVARMSLERTTMLLLTASKTLLRHPDSESARQCRDGVFYQVLEPTDVYLFIYRTPVGAKIARSVKTRKLE